MSTTSRPTAMDQMRRAKKALLLRDPAASLAEVIATDRAAFSGLRLLFASDTQGVTLGQHGNGRSRAPRRLLPR